MIESVEVTSNLRPKKFWTQCSTYRQSTLKHHIPETAVKGLNDQLTLTFVTNGIQSAIEKAAAGDKHAMVVGSANTAQQCLRAGLVDEIRIGIVPVLFGEGLRFFEPLVNEQMELERTRVFESPTRTDLWFRVVK